MTNQNTKHTPEPWIARESAVQSSATNAPILDTANSYLDYRANIANARRIVACVNALEGVSTEDLESGAYRKQIDQLKADHSELLDVVANAMVIAKRGCA